MFKKYLWKIAALIVVALSFSQVDSISSMFVGEGAKQACLGQINDMGTDYLLCDQLRVMSSNIGTAFGVVTAVVILSMGYNIYTDFVKKNKN